MQSITVEWKDMMISHLCAVNLQKIHDQKRDPLPKAGKLLEFDLEQHQKQVSLSTRHSKGLFSNSWKKKQNFLPVSASENPQSQNMIKNKCQIALCVLERIHLSRTQTRRKPSHTNRGSFNPRLGKDAFFGLDLSPKITAPLSTSPPTPKSSSSVSISKILMLVGPNNYIFCNSCLALRPNKCTLQVYIPNHRTQPQKHSSSPQPGFAASPNPAFHILAIPISRAAGSSLRTTVYTESAKFCSN